MSKKFLTFSCGAATLAFAFSTVPAWAGFEWVSPPQGNPGYQQPVTQASPSYATNAPEVISPVIISGTTPAPSVAPAYAPPPVYTPPTPVVQPPAAVVSRAPAYVPITSNNAPAPTGAPLNLATATISVPSSSAGGEPVQGFASQVPLTLALRQLLPTGYNFSIDQNVDMNMLVSYKGGKPWRDTLGDMLASVGLAFHEQGSNVMVSYAAAAAVPAPTPIAAAAPYAPARATYLDTTISAVAPLPTVNVGSADGWSAQRGDTLRKVLSDWCSRNGVELQWLAEYDYPMEASAHFSGDFESAVRDLLDGFDNARPQPYAELHTNAAAGQKLLVVQTRGNSY